MTTTVSPKFQVVIPKEIRTFLKIKPGLKFTVMPGLDGSIKLWPVKERNIKALRGFVKGLDTGIEKEPDRDL